MMRRPQVHKASHVQGQLQHGGAAFRHGAEARLVCEPLVGRTPGLVLKGCVGETIVWRQLREHEFAAVVPFSVLYVGSGQEPMKNFTSCVEARVPGQDLLE